MTTLRTRVAEQAGATGFAERYLLDPALNTEPYGYLNSLRDHAPVYRSRRHRAWLVTGHAPLLRCPREPAVPVAAADFASDGSTTQAGDRIFLVAAAANRAPEKFAQPDLFAGRRTANPHIGFGFGSRFRIGAVLARTVAGSALDVLVRDYPRLARAGHDHDRQPSLLNRSLTALPVRY